MSNLRIYDAVRTVPANAQKRIAAGRLKDKTDINPMWRLKTLTEQFGPCGIGWRYTITDKRLEPGANDEIAAFVDIDLFVKIDGEWSAAIPGTGGSAFVAKERSGLYVSDECFKMALTDAISVACKALGVAADIYWEADRTKYSREPKEQPAPKPAPKDAPKKPAAGKTITEPQIKRLFALAGKGRQRFVRQVLDEYGYEGSSEVKMAEYDEVCDKIKILAEESDDRRAMGDPAVLGIDPSKVFKDDDDEPLPKTYDGEALTGGWDE